MQSETTSSQRHVESKHPGKGIFLMRREWCYFLAIAFIALVWAVLYLPGLRTFPPWYGDETLAITAAQHLFPFPPTHRSFENTFWHPYAPYQPLYLLAVRVGLWMANGDIIGPRLINSLIGLLTALVLFIQGRKLIGSLAALSAALLLLSYEQAILHYRWVFTHNLVGLGFLWAFLSLCGRPSHKKDWSAGTGLSLAFAALPLAAYGAIAAVFVRIRHPGSWLRIGIPPLVVLSASLGLGALACSSPRFLLSDLCAIFDFYAGASAENSGSVFGAIRNLIFFAIHDPWQIAGFLGMTICLFWKRVRPAAVCAWVVAVLLTQNRQNLPLFYYQAMVLLPVMTFCVAASFAFLIRRFGRMFEGIRQRRRLLLALPVWCAILICLAMSVAVANQMIRPRIQPWVTQNPAEVMEAAAWINERTSPTDLVICHHNIAWLLNCRTADFLQWTTWNGVKTWPFATPLPHQQFRFPLELAGAKFVVVGDIDQVWTLLQPNVLETLRKAGIESWPVVWQGEYYAILSNPSLK